MLNMVRIMCDIINVDDKESYEVALAENLQQKSTDPIEEARAFQKYVHNFGWGAESDLAKKIGKVQSISVEG